MSETFGVWELLTRLGQNELGETHLALRKSDSLKVVLKRFSASVHSDTSFYGPLKLELGFAAQLKHASAAAVIEQGEVDGVAFVALEHVDGVSLSKLCSAAQATGGWPLSMDRAVSLMRPVLDALSAAHALTPPLLHRDLVPENVRVTCEGRVVVTDFGLGRARLRAAGNTGMRRAYVSPEQARGNAIDARSEVFAAGLMLFELVCGRLPAQGGAGEVISRIATGELDAPLAVNPLLDDAAIKVLERALAARPEERFASAREFFDALAPWTAESKEEPLGAWVTKLDGVKVAPPAPPPPAPPIVPVTTIVTAAVRPPMRMKPQWMAVAAVVLAVGGFLLTRTPVFSAAVAVDPVNAGRPLELTSIPSGAQVFVDGVLEERRTPLTLYIPKDELRNLMLKKSGFGTWTGLVSNTHKLEVTIATGATEEVRYEGARPGSKEEAAVAPAEPQPVIAEEEPIDVVPRKEVVFDAESPPVEVVLTAAHSVKADLGPTIDVAAGAEASLSEAAMLYVNPPTPSYGKSSAARLGLKPNSASVFGHGGVGSFRALNLFAIKNVAGTIEVVDLARPFIFSKAGQYHLFSPTEAGDLTSNIAYVKINDESIALTAENILRIDQDDSFLIRVLSPKVTYRVEISRADGTSGPVPVVLMAMRPDRDAENSQQGLRENSMRFDGQPLPSGQAILREGAHTLSGARNVWFTLITAQGVVPPDVKLTVRPGRK